MSERLSERVCAVAVLLLLGIGPPVALAALVGVLFPGLAGEARGVAGTLAAVLSLAGLYSIWEG